MKIASFHFEDFSTGAQVRVAPIMNASSKITKPAMEDIPAVPVITEQDIENARREAYGRGFSEGSAEEQRKLDRARQEMEQAKLKVLQSVASGTVALRKEYEKHLTQTGVVVPDLVMAVARKVIGRELKYTPLPALKQTVQDCLARLVHEPIIAVYVHPDLVQGMEAEMKSLAQQENFIGALNVGADDRLAMEDCRIEWKDGMVERNTADMLAQIEAVLKTQIAPLRSKTALESYDKLKDTIE